MAPRVPRKRSRDVRGMSVYFRGRGRRRKQILLRSVVTTPSLRCGRSLSRTLLLARVHVMCFDHVLRSEKHRWCMITSRLEEMLKWGQSNVGGLRVGGGSFCHSLRRGTCDLNTSLRRSRLCCRVSCFRVCGRTGMRQTVSTVSYTGETLTCTLECFEYGVLKASMPGQNTSGCCFNGISRVNGRTRTAWLADTSTTDRRLSLVALLCRHRLSVAQRMEKCFGGHVCVKHMLVVLLRTL